MLCFKIWKVILIFAFTISTCCMSYWHSSSKDGFKIAGLIFTIVLGIIGQILVGFLPEF